MSARSRSSPPGQRLAADERVLAGPRRHQPPCRRACADAMAHDDCVCVLCGSGDRPPRCPSRSLRGPSLGGGISDRPRDPRCRRLPTWQLVDRRPRARRLRDCRIRMAGPDAGPCRPTPCRLRASLSCGRVAPDRGAVGQLSCRHCVRPGRWPVAAHRADARPRLARDLGGHDHPWPHQADRARTETDTASGFVTSTDKERSCVFERDEFLRAGYGRRLPLCSARRRVVARVLSAGYVAL